MIHGSLLCEKSFDIQLSVDHCSTPLNQCDYLSKTKKLLKGLNYYSAQILFIAMDELSAKLASVNASDYVVCAVSAIRLLSAVGSISCILHPGL
jgi:hypothetical protein